MVKDEDVCVHCGLCAERCPTAAWDMARIELISRKRESNGTGPIRAAPAKASRDAAPSSPRVATRQQGDTVHQQQVIKINDFALKLANVNGTGSASANGLLMQAIFRMGIPVSREEPVPLEHSGAADLVRGAGQQAGAHGPRLDYDLMVAMNAETYARDVKEVARVGAALRLELAARKRAAPRRRHLPGRPAGQDVQRIFREPRERILMKNIAYLGALVALLDIDMGVIDELLEEKFSKKKALRDSNHKAIRAGYDFAIENFECPLPIRLEKMHATDDRILIDGNTATALGCLYAGATVAAWYPITPATSVMDSFKELCAKYRKDPETGKNNYCIVQAEDELAAIGMVIGASWNGARSFTSTAGPGISLMSELIGLAYYAEIPAVIVDVQRTGPSTGMPTRTQQGDILACAYASHGDTKHILLFPSSPAECFTMAVAAFDLAERFQTPVFMLSDLDIGMNDWVCPRLKWDDSYRPTAGACSSAAELEKMAKYFRYSPENEDHVAARTLPGVHARARSSRAAPATTSWAATPRSPTSTRR